MAIGKNIFELEEAIGYVFKDKTLIEKALTHSSYANELKAKGENIMYNERLEFLGDSVLSLIASVYLFKGNSTLFEGDLTKIRAGIVCENALYDYAQKTGKTYKGLEGFDPNAEEDDHHDIPEEE